MIRDATKRKSPWKIWEYVAHLYYSQHLFVTLTSDLGAAIRKRSSAYNITKECANQKSRSKRLNGLRRNCEEPVGEHKKPFTCAWLHLSVRQPAHAAKDPMHINSAWEVICIRKKRLEAHVTPVLLELTALGLSYLSRWALGRRNNNTLAACRAQIFAAPRQSERGAGVLLISMDAGCWGLTWVSALFSLLSLCVAEWMYIGIYKDVRIYMYIGGWKMKRIHRMKERAGPRMPPDLTAVTRNIASQINARRVGDKIFFVWRGCTRRWRWNSAFQSYFTVRLNKYSCNQPYSQCKKTLVKWREFSGSDFSAAEIWWKKLCLVRSSKGIF